MKKKFSAHYGKEMIELLPAGEGGLCLDVGCGNGDSKYLIESKGYKWVGLDIRPTNNLSVTGDAHKLPFKNQSFDLVISTAVIEHLHSPMIALNEANRILKTGGIFFGSVAFLEPWHDNSYFHFSHLGIVTMLKDCGFMVDRIWPGWHGLEALLKGLIPFQFIQILAKSIARVIMWMRMQFGLIYAKYKYANNPEKLEKALTFLQQDYLRFAGSIVFLANKS